MLISMQETVPNEWRPFMIGVFDASSIVSQMTPLISWVIIHNTGNWRICYYMMIGFQVFNLAFLVFFYHPPQFKTKHARDGHTFGELVRNFDWIGLFLFTAGCTLFLCGISWGGSLHPWKSAPTLAPIIVGFFTLVGFGFYEAYAPLKEPLMPPRLFKRVRQ
jgi:Fungal trichothecene efflux pump (TRI12)